MPNCCDLLLVKCTLFEVFFVLTWYDKKSFQTMYGTFQFSLRHVGMFLINHVLKHCRQTLNKGKGLKPKPGFESEFTRPCPTF